MIAGAHHVVKIGMRRGVDAVQFYAQLGQMGLQHAAGIEFGQVEGEGHLGEEAKVGPLGENFFAGGVGVGEIAGQHVVADRQIEPLVQNGAVIEGAAGLVIEPHHHQVQLIVEDHVPQIGVGCAEGEQPHVGIGLAEGADDVGHEDAEAPFGGAQAQFAVGVLLQVAILFCQIQLGGFHLAEGGQQQLAGGGEGEDGLAPAEGDAALFLQIGEVFAQVLVGDEEAFGGAGDVFLFAEDEKVAVVGKHGAPSFACSEGDRSFFNLIMPQERGKGKFNLPLKCKRKSERGGKRGEARFAAKTIAKI